MRNITYLDDPCIATCEYIVLKEYLDKYNIKWEETKYYWDSEDVYFGMLLFTYTNNIKILPELYYFHPKHINSNSDRRNYKTYYKYTIYMCDMYKDILSFCKNKYYLNILNKILLNICKETKRIKKGDM